MQADMIAPVFLVLALALGWPRFVIIFSAGTGVAAATAPLTMVATTISLSALGLAFANNGPWLGALIAALGPLLSRTVRIPAPLVAIPLSALCLAAYLRVVAIG